MLDFKCFARGAKRYLLMYSSIRSPLANSRVSRGTDYLCAANLWQCFVFGDLQDGRQRTMRDKRYFRPQVHNSRMLISAFVSSKPYSLSRLPGHRYMHTHTHCIKSEAAKLQTTLTTLLSCSSRTVSIQDAAGQSQTKTDNGSHTHDIAKLQLEHCKHARLQFLIKVR